MQETEGRPVGHRRRRRDGAAPSHSAPPLHTSRPVGTAREAAAAPAAKKYRPDAHRRIRPRRRARRRLLAAPPAPTGASFSWALSLQDDTFAPLGVAAGFVSPLSPCATESTEIMRSCGGAVQGLTETQGPSEIALNRAHDGFVYFDDGSWALAPTLLDAESLDTSPSAFGLAASLARGAGRARCLLTVLDAAPYNADVSIEALLGGEPSAVAEALLGGRLQVVVNANVWEGGATSRDVVGDAPGGGPFSPLRAKWAGRLRGRRHPSPRRRPAPPTCPAACGRASARAPETCLVEVGSIDADLASASSSSCPDAGAPTRRAAARRAAHGRVRRIGNKGSNPAAPSRRSPPPPPPPPPTRRAARRRTRRRAVALVQVVLVALAFARDVPLRRVVEQRAAGRAGSSAATAARRPSTWKSAESSGLASTLTHQSVVPVARARVASGGVAATAPAAGRASVAVRVELGHPVDEAAVDAAATESCAAAGGEAARRRRARRTAGRWRGASRVDGERRRRRGAAGTLASDSGGSAAGGARARRRRGRRARPARASRAAAWWRWRRTRWRARPTRQRRTPVTKARRADDDRDSRRRRRRRLTRGSRLEDHVTRRRRRARGRARASRASGRCAASTYPQRGVSRRLATPSYSPPATSGAAPAARRSRRSACRRARRASSCAPTLPRSSTSAAARVEARLAPLALRKRRRAERAVRLEAQPQRPGRCVGGEPRAPRRRRAARSSASIAAAASSAASMARSTRSRRRRWRSARRRRRPPPRSRRRASRKADCVAASTNVLDAGGRRAERLDRGVGGVGAGRRAVEERVGRRARRGLGDEIARKPARESARRGAR